MLLNLNKKFITANKEEIDGKSMGEILADVLSNQKTEHIKPLKAWGWALKLSASESLDLDKEDMNNLEKFINSSSMVPFVQAQLLQEINNAKENNKDN